MRKKSLEKCAEEYVRVGEIGVFEAALGGVEGGGGGRKRIGGGAWGFVVVRRVWTVIGAWLPLVFDGL